MAAMEKFLADFAQGMAEGRYLDRSLPHLDFRDREFDLALCSHFPAWWKRDARGERGLGEVSWDLAAEADLLTWCASLSGR